MCENDRQQSLCWSTEPFKYDPQLLYAQREGSKTKHEMVVGQHYSNKSRRKGKEGEKEKWISVFSFYTLNVVTHYKYNVLAYLLRVLEAKLSHI